MSSESSDETKSPATNTTIDNIVSLTNIELIEKKPIDINRILSDATSMHDDDNDSVIADIFDDFQNELDQPPQHVPSGSQNLDTSCTDPLSKPQKSKKLKFLKKLIFSLDGKTISLSCCGGSSTTKFSCISCLSMLALLLNITTLLIIIGLSIASNLSYQSINLVDVMSLVTESMNMHTTMGSRVREVSYNTNAYVPSSVVTTFYSNSKTTLMNDLKNLSSIISSKQQQLNLIVDLNFTSTPNTKLWESVLSLISGSSTGGQAGGGSGNSSTPQPGSGGNGTQSGNSTQPGSGGGTRPTSSVNVTELYAAQKVLTSVEYLEKETANTNHFNAFLNDLIALCSNAHNTARYTLIASLALICTSIVIVIPFAVLIFLIGLINSSKDEKKLFKANTILLYETFDHSTLNPLFEKFCFSIAKDRQFHFIAKCREFSQLCKRSLELQLRTFEISQEFLKVGGELIEKPNALVLKQVNQNEKFLREVEYMKQQVAFELVECMDSNNSEMGSMVVGVSKLCYDEVVGELDRFNNKEDDYQVLDILPVDLFERCEEEIVQSLIDAHTYFKQTDDFFSAAATLSTSYK